MLVHHLFHPPWQQFSLLLAIFEFLWGLSSGKQPAIKDVKCNSSFIIFYLRKHNHLDTLTHQFFYGGYALFYRIGNRYITHNSVINRNIGTVLT
jgi:hypothetical protein